MLKYNLSELISCIDRYEDATIIKIAIIKKLPNGKWKVMSMKGKPLGEYKTKAEAVERLRQIEYFKKHKKPKKKQASKEETYSSIMRNLKKSYDSDTVQKFQKTFKEIFDKELLVGSDTPETAALEAAIKCIDEDDYKKAFIKSASVVDLGDPVFAGRYLANIIKFLTLRISHNKRPKSLENLKKKIYYLNEYGMAAKKVPASSSLGQSITLIKTILLEHPPQYIRAVLNNIVMSL